MNVNSLRVPSPTRSRVPGQRLGLLLGALALFLSACASMPPDRIAYNSIDGAKAGVVAAIRAWNDLYQQGRYTDADRARVETAYNRFGASVAVATDLAKTATTEEQKMNALAYVNAAASDVMRLLREFDVVK